MALFAVPDFDKGHVLWLRVALASIVSAVFMFLGAYELWRGRDEQLPSRLPAMAFYISGGAFFTFRIAATGWLPFPLGGLQPHPLAIAAFNFVIVLHVMFITIWMIGLTKERRELGQRMLAETDALTGLPNRRAFAAEVEKLLARSKAMHVPVAVMLLDLDHFKSINDRFGHDAGDRVLMEFAGVLDRCLRRQDLRYRIGGEEFCCALPDVTLREAQAIAERICATFEAGDVEVLGGIVRSTVSIGVTSTDLCGYGLDDLLAEADAAAYEAKAAGRNRAVLAISSPRLAGLALIDDVAGLREGRRA